MIPIQKKQIQLLRQYADALQSEKRTRTQQLMLLQVEKDNLIKKNNRLRSKILNNSQKNQPNTQYKMVKEAELLVKKVRDEQIALKQIQQQNRQMKVDIENIRSLQNIQANQKIKVNELHKRIVEENQFLKSQLLNINKIDESSKHKGLYMPENNLQSIRHKLRQEQEQKMNIEVFQMQNKYEALLRQKQQKLQNLQNRFQEQKDASDQSFIFEEKIVISELKIKEEYCAKLRQDCRNQIRQLQFLSVNQDLQLIKNQYVTYELEKNKLIFAQKCKVQQKMLKLIETQKLNISELEAKVEELNRRLDLSSIQRVRTNNYIKNEKLIFQNKHKEAIDKLQSQNSSLKQTAKRFIRSNKQLQSLFATLVNEKYEEESNIEKKFNKKTEIEPIESTITFMNPQAHKAGFYHNNEYFEEELEIENEMSNREEIGHKKIKNRYQKVDESFVNSYEKEQTKLEQNESVGKKVQKLKKENEELGQKDSLEAKIKNLKLRNKELRKDIFQ